MPYYVGNRFQVCRQKSYFSTHASAYDFWVNEQHGNPNMEIYKCSTCQGYHIKSTGHIGKGKAKRNRERVQRRKRELRLQEIHTLLLRELESRRQLSAD